MTNFFVKAIKAYTSLITSIKLLRTQLDNFTSKFLSIMFYVFYKPCFFILMACIDSDKFVDKFYFQNQTHACKIIHSFEL